jgi:hypothetical protein
MSHPTYLLDLVPSNVWFFASYSKLFRNGCEKIHSKSNRESKRNCFEIIIYFSFYRFAQN